MDGTKIKLCGLRREADIRVANELLPDYIGFVFAAGARRAVDAETARRLRNLLDPRIRAVGVFVNQSPEEIAEIAASVPLDCIQLHGDESEESLAKVCVLTGKPVWRAVQVTGSAALERALQSRADMLLLDSGKGSGERFAWDLLAGFSRPYMLAGGLNAENVGTAIKTLAPFGVDVSSALESEGQKDPEKMRVFAEAVRRADRVTER